MKYSFINFFRQLGTLALITITIVGCTPKSYTDFSNQVDQTQQKLDQQFNQKITMDSHLGPVLVSDGQANAPWLKTKISIRTQSMPLNQVANKILQGSGAANAFQQDVNQTTPITLNYQGSRRDALRLLATQSGYAYTITENIVTWSTLVTKTFDVSFMPGSSKYMVGDSATTGGSSNSTSNTSTSGSPNTLNNDGQYSSIQGELSIWNDLSDTVKSMLSHEGKAIVSQATTTITVTDHPNNVRNIENYLQKMNRDMSRQVALDVQVLQVTLDKRFNYGIDWNLVREFISGRYNIALASNSNSALNTGTDSPQTLLFKANSGVWNGTQTFINAIAQQGKVSVATQPRVVTLNNQVAEIGLNTQTTYLSAVTTTVTAQVGSSTSLTPSTVTDGFSLYLLPKIQGNNVYLQISSTLANLLDIKKYEGTTLNSSSNSSSNSNAGNTNVIYAPVVEQKRFNQRSIVPSGETLVLAGFKQLASTANKNSVLGSDTLGGYYGDNNDKETIVLITPTVLSLKG